MKTQSTLDYFRKLAAIIPQTPEATAQFNQQIQSEIIRLEHIRPRKALELAQIKLDLNKRLYQVRAFEK